MPDLNITLIQSNLFWENIDANLQMFGEKIAAIHHHTEIIFLPEMFSTGFSMNTEKLAETMDGSAIQWMKKTAQQHHIILCGSLMIKENDQYYNRLIWMLPNGTYGQYDKRHLFAYGKENLHYAAGNKRLIASVNGWKICLNICYDLRFPVWSRQAPRQNSTEKNYEYDLLVYVANWPQQRALAWNTLLQARAIENQCYVAGINRVGEDGNNIMHDGDSSVIDPLGKFIYRKNKEEDIFTCTLSFDRLNEIRQRFPFLDDADKFVIL